MKALKDHFSTQAEVYATFRPRYPDALFEFLFSVTTQKETSWDCGTGNGQVAVKLAERFHLVYATDISERQLSNALERENVTYLVGRAEETTISDGSINLTTVAQALHWFDTEAFYREVHRVATPQAVIAVWGYNLLRVSPAIDALGGKI